MPSIRVTRRGANSSSAPSARLNQPSPRASLSAAVSELGPVLTIFGSPLDRTRLERWNIGLHPLRLQDDFDAAVLLVSEHPVHVGPALQRHAVGDDEGGIDLAAF